MAHILLVDDDSALSGMLTEYLAGEGFQTTAVLNGEDALAATASKDFDVVILDIMLPGINGIEILHRIRQSSGVPIIMLTAKGDDVDRVVGLEMGADDYVTKPYHPRELVARIRAVLRRHSPILMAAKNDVKIGRLELSLSKRECRFAGDKIDLTVCEFNIMDALLRVADHVVTKEELSVKALGKPREPYDRSIDVHLSNVRRKLAAVAGDAVEIETVRGIGYRLKVSG